MIDREIKSKAISIDTLIAGLSRYRFSLTSEKTLQSEIGGALTTLGYQFDREVALFDGAIIDFLVGNIGIEVKIKGSPLRIFRQLERYCASPRVAELLFLTAKTIGLPDTISGKPAHIISLGAAWL